MCDTYTDYPKSSCLCAACPVRTNRFIDASMSGCPNNLSTVNSNCNKSFLYNCYDKGTFDINLQPPLCTDFPDTDMDITNLNHLGLTYTPDFEPVICKDGVCPEITYASHDPRLLDPARNSLLKLDSPSREGFVSNSDVPLDTIYQPRYGKYGKGYTSYSNTNSGQIQYYVDKTIAPAYFQPLFTMRSNVDNLLFIDPMGGRKPQYIRTPLDEYNWQYHKKDGSDQFTYDTVYQREDIMAKQMQKINQKKWTARYPLN